MFQEPPANQNAGGSVAMVWTVSPDVWWLRLGFLELVALVVGWSVGRPDSPGLSSPMLVPHLLMKEWHHHFQPGRRRPGTWWRRASIKNDRRAEKNSWKAAELILSVVSSVFATDGGPKWSASLYHCHSVFTYILNILKKDYEGLITTRTKVVHHLVTMNDFTKIYLSPCRRDKWTCWSASAGIQPSSNQDIFTQDFSGGPNDQDTLRALLLAWLQLKQINSGFFFTLCLIARVQEEITTVSTWQIPCKSKCFPCEMPPYFSVSVLSQ